MTRVLVLDNDDSFVHTLVGYLELLGATPEVRRSRDVAADELPGMLAGVDGVLVSPGPGTPEHAGVSVAAVRQAATSGLPLLGVCLGHQAIAVAFGGTVAHAPELMHGRTSRIAHDGAGVFAGLPPAFTATRYHSLAAVEGSLPAELVVSARSETGVVMGVRHRELPIEGVQFHPEAVLTEGGHRLLANWLTATGSTDALARAEGMRPLVGGTGDPAAR
jgi:para-aminobenzoate synthetase component II